MPPGWRYRLLVAAPEIGEISGFSRGFAAQLDSLLTEFIGSKGFGASRTDGLNAVSGHRPATAGAERRLDDTEKRYRTQFTALDVTLGQLTQTSNYMAKQLAALSGSSS